jgi:hypothetical protein
MTDRHKPHNGRDLSGKYGAPAEDVDDILTDATGPDVIRSDIKRAGAVADTGMDAGTKAREISKMIDENRDDVRRVSRKDGSKSSSKNTRR